MMINNVLEPTRLWLTWQPQTGGTRFVVGKIERDGDCYRFYYETASDDFENAQVLGFAGFPAFRLKMDMHDINALEPFLRRLPPRSRGDFSRYLAQHFLPAPFLGSDFALLAHTGAKSPADGFCLVPDLSTVTGPYDILLEVVGTRYRVAESGLDLGSVNIGDLVTFMPEPCNKYDPCAIAVNHQAGSLGYVNKVLCPYVGKKVSERKVIATVAKLNGTPERPLVYLMVRVQD